MHYLRPIALCLTFALVMSAGLPAYGNDECTGIVLAPKTVVIEGVQHVALSPRDAGCLLKRAEEAQKLRGLVDTHERLGRLLRLQVQTASTALYVARSALEDEKRHSKMLLDLSLQQERDIQRLQGSQESAVYRSPIFWSLVVLAGVLVVNELGGSNPSVVAVR